MEKWSRRVKRTWEIVLPFLIRISVLSDDFMHKEVLPIMIKLNQNLIGKLIINNCRSWSGLLFLLVVWELTIVQLCKSRVRLACTGIRNMIIQPKPSSICADKK
jgi:hypothetical protein